MDDTDTDQDPGFAPISGDYVFTTTDTTGNCPVEPTRAAPTKPARSP